MKATTYSRSKRCTIVPQVRSLLVRTSLTTSIASNALPATRTSHEAAVPLNQRFHGGRAGTAARLSKPSLVQGGGPTVLTPSVFAPTSHHCATMGESHGT